MRKDKRRSIPHRRKREGKTDYNLRLRLLKSGRPRFVVRRSSNNILCQIIDYKTEGDNVVASSDSKELQKYGWKSHGGNLPSAYLTGLLCGLRAKSNGVKEAAMDIGLYPSTRGNKLFSALKGALDGGLKIPHSEDILPGKERITGKHIADLAQLLKKKEPEKYKKVFSAYLKKKADPENLQKMFEEVKKKIISNQGRKPGKKPSAGKKKK